MNQNQENIFNYFQNRWQLEILDSPERPEPWFVREFFKTHINAFVDPEEICQAVLQRGNEYENRASEIASIFLGERIHKRRMRSSQLSVLREKEIRSILENDHSLEILFRKTLRVALRETWKSYQDGNSLASDQDELGQDSATTALDEPGQDSATPTLDNKEDSPSDKNQNKKETAVIFGNKGDIWHIGQFEYRSVKGFGYILSLLISPNRPIPALELASPDYKDKVIISANSDELIDQETVESYKKELNQLSAERLKAIDQNNKTAIDEINRRFNFIKEQLQKSTALGGRRRKFNNNPEKARTAVTQAINRAIKKIRKNDKNIGAHLLESIKTGSSCQYSPPPNSQIDWKF